jgi:hypothetical protein
LNGVTDDQFIDLIKIKDKSSGKLSFSVNSSIGSTSQITLPSGKPGTVINNITLNFSDAEGAKFAAELFQMLAG